MKLRVFCAIAGSVATLLCLCSLPAPASAFGQSDTLRLFPFQDSLDILGAVPIALGGDSVLVLTRYRSGDADSAIYAVTSGDAGHTWGTPKVIGYDRFSRRYISAIRLPSGGVLVVWPGSKGIVQAESDSTVSSWSTPHMIRPNLLVLNLRLHYLADDMIWLTYLVPSYPGDDIIMVMGSTDCGRSWSSPTTLLTGPEYLPGLVAAGSGQIAMFYSPGTNTGIVRRVTNDNGQTWTGGDTVLLEGASSKNPWILRTENHTHLTLYQVESYTETRKLLLIR